MELDFGSVWATLGLFALLGFALLAALGAIGTAVLWVSGRYGRSGGLLGAVAVLAALAGGLVWWVVDDFDAFHTLTIEADGTWRMENIVGQTLLVLPPDAMRAVDFMQAESVAGARTPSTQTWVRIELPDGRVFESVHSAENHQRPATEKLREFVGQHRS
ncbi:MAG: hypothetical protein KC620_18810 [Myxococcales bacterium]|nr:hypothetical protein [Myxococcales bacterium]